MKKKNVKHKCVIEKDWSDSTKSQKIQLHDKKNTTVKLTHLIAPIRIQYYTQLTVIR